MGRIAKAIKSAKEVRILSGEGEFGTVDLFTGRRTERALIRRIKKEKRGGRWCHAKVDGENLYLTDDGLMF